MPTVRLLASAYQLSSTSYLAISNTENMYTDVDSSTYATVNHKRSATTSYYIYVRGFNWSAIPDGAVITSAVVKVKANVSGAGSYTPGLYNGTTSLSTSFNGSIQGGVYTRTVDITSKFDTFKAYGSNFGIRLQLNRSSKNTASYMYIYGAEITVTYQDLVYHTVTTTAVGDATIDPSGSTEVIEGSPFGLSITAKAKPTVTDNGADVTSQLVEQPMSGTITSTPASYSTSGSITGTYYQQAVGKDHNTSSTTGNNYASSSGSNATISYAFNVSSVPDDAQILSVSCKVKGHCESTTSSSEKAECQLYSGSTAKGSAKSFTSTTDAVIELSDATWTRAELNSAKLNFTIGYYGGNVSGASLIVEYAIESEDLLFVYTISSVAGDHTIVVTAAATDQLKLKVNGAWVNVTAVYRKVNGAWVKQSNLSSLFDTNTKYVHAN